MEMFGPKSTWTSGLFRDSSLQSLRDETNLIQSAGDAFIEKDKLIHSDIIRYRRV